MWKKLKPTRTKLMPDGTVRYYVNGIRVTEKGERYHSAPCFRKAPKCINPHEGLDNPALGAEMCAEAKQAATLAVAGALTGLAAARTDDTPAVVPEGDEILTVADAARRTGLSKGALYRDKNLP